jgi:DNA-binding NtrC family response regulator
MRDFRVEAGRLCVLPRVLIISEDSDRRGTVGGSVCRCMLRPIGCATVAAAQDLLSRQRFVAVLCVALSKEDFRAVIKLVARSKSCAPVIIVSHLDDWDHYLAFMSAGAFDHVDLPLYPGELERVLYSALCESRSSLRTA